MVQMNYPLKKEDVLIIDYGVGNHLSIINALIFLGYKFKVSNKKKDIINARSYILPGVGAFSKAMNNLRELGLIEVLSEQILIQKKPILGICLGMQIFANDSEENGFYQGLGWIKGHVTKIKNKNGCKVPQVGWNNLEIAKKKPLFTKFDGSPHFYFDHSYHFSCKEEFISAKCWYGEDIIAAVQKENIFGIQFHPEKSQNNGLKLLRSFFEHFLKEKDSF